MFVAIHEQVSLAQGCAVICHCQIHHQPSNVDLHRQYSRWENIPGGRGGFLDGEGGTGDDQAQEGGEIGNGSTCHIPTPPLLGQTSLHELVGFVPAK